MLKFQNVELKDIDSFMKHWEQTSQLSSDYCFPILWGWAVDYEYQAAEDGSSGLLWIRQTKPGIYNNAPIGDWERDDWERLIRENYGESCDFWLIPEKLAEIWQAQLGKAMTKEDMRGNWEYLYDIRELAELKGGKYIKKRNRVHHFKKNYAYEYKPITVENAPAVKAFQQKWLSESEGYLPGIKQESDCIMRILDSWGQVPHLRGGIIEVAGNIVAYTIGELAQEELFVHFEKALLEYNSGYQLINQEFILRMLEEAPDLKTVNREEDLDDPGLREAKLSYHPTGFVKKYLVKLRF